MIIVKQPRGNLLWIQTPKTSSASHGSSSGGRKKQKIDNKNLTFRPQLQTWDDCDAIQVICLL